MRRFLIPLFLVLTLVVGLTGCRFKLPFISSKASLQINSVPPATIFLNGKHVGQTPFTQDDLTAADITLKLVPEGAAALSSWETKVTLTPKVRTIVNRQFGPTLDQSAGEILSLQPLAKSKSAALAIVSTPDSVVVQLDDQPQGFTPLSLDQLTPGDHKITLSAPGYQDRSLNFRLETGYKLVLTAQLARLPLEESISLEPSSPATPSALPSPSPVSSPPSSTVASASATAKAPPYVEIIANPLGFLRVRANPSTGATELARAYPGQRLPYQGEESNGWYKVEYASGQTGWVARGASGEYAKLVQ